MNISDGLHVVPLYPFANQLAQSSSVHSGLLSVDFFYYRLTPFFYQCLLSTQLPCPHEHGEVNKNKDKDIMEQGVQLFIIKIKPRITITTSLCFVSRGVSRNAAIYLLLLVLVSYYRHNHNNHILDIFLTIFCYNHQPSIQPSISQSVIQSID